MYEGLPHKSAALDRIPRKFYRRGMFFLPALPYAQSIFNAGGIPNEPDSHWKLHRTQEQLAQQLGVSNKTISKWENGTCMPDYSIIQKLCDAIHVTLPELMDGEDAAEDSVRVYDDEQILNLLRRTQESRSGRRAYSAALSSSSSASPAAPCPKPPAERMYRTSSPGSSWVCPSWKFSQASGPQEKRF